MIARLRLVGRARESRRP